MALTPPQQLPLTGLEMPRPARDPLERVYTPYPVAHAATRVLDDCTHSQPRRVLELHAGGGAWVKAVRQVWGQRPRVLALDVDEDAPIFHTVGDDRIEKDVADSFDPSTLERVRRWAPDLIVGNPPFKRAREQLTALWDGKIQCRIAWILPYDIYSCQAWAKILTAHPPAVIRPITRRVWTCVRGVAVWEWWAGRPASTTIIPLNLS